MKYVWIRDFAAVLAVAGSHSINSLIYMVYWTNICWHFGNVPARRNEKHMQESQAAVVVLGETRTAHILHAL